MRKILSILLCAFLLTTSLFTTVLAADFDYDMGEIYDGDTYNITDLQGKYKTQGRYALIDGVLMTDYTASGIEFNAFCEGKVSVTFNAKALNLGEGGGCYFTVIVDGETMPRDFCHITELGDVTVTIAENLDKATHNFQIYRQTEIEYATIGIKSITIMGEMLDAPANNDLYIEFVGSSTTTGFGNLGTSDITDQDIAARPIYQDGTQALAYLTAKALGADYSIVARQGTGARYSWQKQTMIEVYPLLRAAKDTSTEYDFTREADIVVCGLGGNDVTKAASLNQEAGTTVVTDEMIVESYIEMVNLIKSKNPDAKIVWICNMTATNTYPLVSEAIEQLGGAEDGYYALSLTSDANGAKAHATAAAHKIQAEELTTFIRDNLLYNDKEFSSIVGNSVRATGNQGLRFKYCIDTEKLLEKYTGYSVKEIGALAIRTDYLSGAELVLNGVYEYNNKSRAAVKGVFFNEANNINAISDKGICSALLFNIGYNKTDGTVNYNAYDYSFSVRTYIILESESDEKVIYGDTDTASVFAVFDTIIDKYNTSAQPPEELCNDYNSVQAFLSKEEKDVNGKTINDIYSAR